MRRLLLPKLLQWKESKSRKPLLLQGARQVGKTTLLHQFGKAYFSKTHSLNFEKDLNLATIFEKNLDPKHLLKELEFFLKQAINYKEDLLILDEIQACPRALTSLKYFSEEMPELAVTAAGSLLGIYLGPVSFPVGKVDIMTLFPMTFEEFLLALDEPQLLTLLNGLTLQDSIPEAAHQRLFEKLIHYFIVGGLPEVVKKFRDEKNSLFLAFEKVRQTQNALIETYLADIAKHSGKVNAMHIARVWQSVPSQLAQNHNGNATKFKFKDVVPGIDRYNRLASAIDWLVAARLIIKVPIVNCGQLPFSAYAEENTFKLYLFDVGLLGAMGNLSPQAILEYNYGSYKGYFAENFIAQSFLTNGMRNLYSWQEKMAEVEFLYEDNLSAIPIEVKSGWVTHAKSAKIFAEKYKSPYRVTFSARNLSISPTHRSLPLYLADWFLF